LQTFPRSTCRTPAPRLRDYVRLRAIHLFEDGNGRVTWNELDIVDTSSNDQGEESLRRR